MANEITISSGLQAIKSNANITINLQTKQADWTGTRFIRNVQAIGTSHEAITVSDVSTAGYAYFTNLDATNYVELGVDVSSTFYPLVRIDAGKTAGPFRLSTLTFYGRANTAAVNLDLTILEA